MSAGILDGFQTIIPTAAAVLSEKRQMLRLTQQEIADRAKNNFASISKVGIWEKKYFDLFFWLGVSSS